MTKIILLGAGGFAREARVWAFQSGCNVVGFFEEGTGRTESEGKNPLPIWNVFLNPKMEFLPAVGDCLLKLRLVDRAQNAGLQACDAIVHPSVVYGSSVAIGQGTILCPRVVVSSDIRIGRWALINIGVTVGHDVMIGDYCTLSPGAHISGHATIGRGSYIGTGAVIKEGVTVGDKAMVGMGAVVIRDVPDGETWAGNPARKIG